METLKPGPMLFDPNNNVIKLCAKGMNFEGEGKKEEALECFQQACNEATNNFEKFISAHYIARHQMTPASKLYWNETALDFALKMNDEDAKAVYPSLYLNIGKCHEDLNNLEEARKNYETALSFVSALNDDGYGRMIKGGILLGLERIELLDSADTYNLNKNNL